MQPDIAADHLELILADLPEEGVMLEWGSGGSTAWFAKEKPDSAHLYSIEHDKVWWEKVVGLAGLHDNVFPWLIPPEADVGPYGTHHRENPAGLHNFISGTTVLEVVKKADVIFIDGCARSCCLAIAAHYKKKSAVVYLHDAQRPWYQWSYKMLHDFKLHPPAEGHASSLLRGI